MENQLFFSFNHFLLKSLGYRTAQPTKQSKDCQIDQFDKTKIAKEPLMSTKTNESRGGWKQNYTLFNTDAESNT